MISKEELIQELRSMGINDKVISAMEKTKRELFVPPEFQEISYDNIPLPIGYEQTISQPYTVAYMIQLLDIKQGNKILEIGSGSGYNAAVMSHLVGRKGKIISLEIIKERAEITRKNLKSAGIRNVKVIHTNGYYGYEKESPYDRIIVTAGSPEIPKHLMKQLKMNGVMVIPIRRGFGEVMFKIVKKEKPIITECGDFAFVPLRKE